MSQPDVEGSSLAEIGDQFCREGKVSAALHYYRRALEEDSSAFIHTRSALALFIKGDWRVSASHIERALEIEPDFYPAKLLYLKWLIQSGENEKAETISASQYENYPDNTCVLILMGQQSMGTNRYTEAENLFKKALSSYKKWDFTASSSKWNPFELPSIAYFLLANELPKDDTYYHKIESFLHFRLGESLLFQGRYEESIEEYQKSISLYGESIIPRVALGDCFIHCRRLKDATLVFQEICKLFPTISAGFDGMGRIYRMEADILEGEAIRHLNDALRYRPVDISQAYGNLGNAYKQALVWDEAESYYRKALQLDSKNISASEGLGIILCTRNEHHEAIEYLKKCESAPTSHKQYVYLAESYMKIGDYENATQALQKAISIEPNDASTYVQLGVLHNLQNKPNEALKYMQQALKISPLSPQVYQHLQKLKSQPEAQYSCIIS